MSVGQQVIRSVKDPKVIDFIRLSTEKRLRYAWRKTIISSATLISELSAKFEFEDVMLDKKAKVPVPFRHKNLYVFTPDIICRIGQLKHSRAGILATLPIPSPLSVEAFEPKRWLILDGITDLGELGTIIRSAVAFDWDGVWLTHTCGDPFDPACIRASQGAMFTLPYRIGSIHNAIKHARRSPGTVKLHIGEGTTSKETTRVDAPSPMELIFNSETSTTPVCLLVQRMQADSVKPNEFRTVCVGEMDFPERMPIGINTSAIMMKIGKMYTNRNNIS